MADDGERVTDTVSTRGPLASRREEILQVARSHGARQVRVFGSMARGQAQPSSDIDLLVDLEAGRSLLDLVAIKQDLEDILGRQVDVLTEAGISPYIKAQVLRDAVLL